MTERVAAESTVSADIAIMGSEDDLKKLHSDEYRTNLGAVGKQTHAAFRLEGLFENFLNGARKALHSYTHARMLQSSRGRHKVRGKDSRSNHG